MDALLASANACKLASTVSPFTKFEVCEMLPYNITNTPLELGRTRAGVATQQLVSTEKTTGGSLPRPMTCSDGSALVNRNNTKKEKNQVIPWLLHLILALHKPWAPLTSDLRRISDAISVHSA